LQSVRILELASTKYLFQTVAICISLIVGTFGVLLYLGITDVETLATFTDAVFKTVAVLVGTLWALNRYFVQRTDAPRLRVDADVGMIRGPSTGDPRLLIFRLDLVNTGTTQIGVFNHYVQVDAVTPRDDGVEFQPLYRWPESDWHSGGPIEPGSWSAINSEVSCAASVRAVRLFVEVKLSDSARWTWHKTFDVSGGEKSSNLAHQKLL